MQCTVGAYFITFHLFARPVGPSHARDRPHCWYARIDLSLLPDFPLMVSFLTNGAAKRRHLSAIRNIRTANPSDQRSGGAPRNREEQCLSLSEAKTEASVTDG